MTTRPRKPAAGKAWATQRRIAATKPNGQTQTIATIIARTLATTGREPTDAQIAATLATSVARVRHHRKLLSNKL